MILQAIASSYKYGFDIMDITGLPSGSVYPALRRLEESGLVDSRWEKEGVAQRDRRPPRKYYELTRPGKEALAEALKRYRLLDRLIPSVPQSVKPTTERG
ncbi:MAG TPA: PadR family transcriptional regulator [Candidatus Binatia bacterium]